MAAADLPFFLGLIGHLSAKGVPCPLPVAARDGRALRRIADKPAAIVTFLRGNWPRRQTASHCEQVGAALAEMHLAGADFTLCRANALSIEGWGGLVAETAWRADGVRQGLREEIVGEFEALRNAWPEDLPSGVIHADLFPDNVFFLGDTFSGLIDFYFACNDAFSYDIAICLNAWCFENDVDFNITKARRLLAGYRRVTRTRAEGIGRPARSGAGRRVPLPADPPLRLAEPGRRRAGEAEEPARIPDPAPLPPPGRGARRLRSRLRASLPLPPPAPVW